MAAAVIFCRGGCLTLRPASILNNSLESLVIKIVQNFLHNSLTGPEPTLYVGRRRDKLSGPFQSCHHMGPSEPEQKMISNAADSVEDCQSVVAYSADSADSLSDEGSIMLPTV